jgi:hypothetical protein
VVTIRDPRHVNGLRQFVVRHFFAITKWVTLALNDQRSRLDRPTVFHTKFVWLADIDTQQNQQGTDAAPKPKRRSNREKLQGVA